MKVDVQLIETTRRPLEKMVEAKEFLLDLRARLRGYEIWLPPLRERMEDIRDLALAFLPDPWGQAVTWAWWAILGCLLAAAFTKRLR